MSYPHQSPLAHPPWIGLHLGQNRSLAKSLSEAHGTQHRWMSGIRPLPTSSALTLGRSANEARPTRTMAAAMQSVGLSGTHAGDEALHLLEGMGLGKAGDAPTS